VVRKALKTSLFIVPIVDGEALRVVKDLEVFLYNAKSIRN